MMLTTFGKLKDDNVITIWSYFQKKRRNAKRWFLKMLHIEIITSMHMKKVKFQKTCIRKNDGFENSMLHTHTDSKTRI